MDDKNPHILELAKAIADHRLVPIIGAGVSTSTARLPGWVRLVENGLVYVEQLGTHRPEQINEVRQLLQSGQTVQAAQGLKALLQAPGGEYRRWLRNMFRIAPEQVVTDRLVGAIRRLYCPVIGTTNYDKLLSILHMPSLSEVSWRNPALMHDALTEGGAVLHLHGVFDDPESVVFGEDDYETVVQRAPAYRDILRTLWLDRTLLFIGCSFEGIEDPDFKNLLEWAARTFPDDAHKHYALVRNDSLDPDKVAHFLHDRRIQLVGYGNAYDDLAPFIEALGLPFDQATSDGDAVSPLQHQPVFSGSEVQQLVRDRESLRVRATTDHERYLLAALERLRSLLNGGYARPAQDGLEQLIQEIEAPESSNTASEMHGRVYHLAANAFMPVLPGGDQARAEGYLLKARELLISDKGKGACDIVQARLLSLASRNDEAFALLAQQSHPDAKRVEFSIHLDGHDLASCAALIEELAGAGALDGEDWYRLLAMYYAQAGDEAQAIALVDKLAAVGEALDYATAASVLTQLAYREYMEVCRSLHICPEAHFASDLGLDEFVDKGLEMRAVYMYERAADEYENHGCLSEAAGAIVNALRIQVASKTAELTQRLKRLDPDSPTLVTSPSANEPAQVEREPDGQAHTEHRLMDQLRELLNSHATDMQDVLDLVNALLGSNEHGSTLIKLLEANVERFQASEDTRVRYLYLLFRLYTTVRLPEETEAWLASIEFPEHYAHLKLVFHVVFYLQRDPIRMGEWLESALQAYPDRPEVLKLAIFYYGNVVHDETQALQHARRLFEVFRTGQTGSLLLEYLLASKAYGEIIQLATDQNDTALPFDQRVLHRALGRAYSAESRYMLARPHLEWMRQSGDANVTDMLTFTTNCVYTGDLDSAVAIMREAIIRYPDEPRVYLVLSDVYLQRGDSAEGYRVALDAYRRFHDDPEVALHLLNTGMSTGQHSDGAVVEVLQAFQPGGRFEQTGYFQQKPFEEAVEAIRHHREWVESVYQHYVEGRSSLMMTSHLQNAPLFRAHSEMVRFRLGRYAAIGAHLYDVANRIQSPPRVVLDYSALLTLWSLYGNRWAYVLSANYEQVWIPAKLIGILTWEYELLLSRGQADRHHADTLVRDAANQLYSKLQMLPRLDPENGQDAIGENTETTAARARTLPYLQEHISGDDNFPGIQIVGLRAIAEALVADGRLTPDQKTHLVQHARDMLPGEETNVQRLTPGSDIVTGITTLTTIALNGGLSLLQVFLESFGTIYYSEPAWQRLQGEIAEYEQLRKMAEDLRRLREQVGDAIRIELVHLYTCPPDSMVFPLLEPEDAEPSRGRALDALNAQIEYLNDLFGAAREQNAPLWTDDRWTVKASNGLALDARPPDVFSTDSFLIWNRLRAADDADYYDHYSKLVRWRYFGLPLNADYLFWLVAEKGYPPDRGLVADACAVYVYNVLHYVAPDTVLGAVTTEFKQELLDGYGQSVVVLLHKCYTVNMPVERAAALFKLLDLTRQNVSWEMEPYHYYSCLLFEAMVGRGLELVIEAVMQDDDRSQQSVQERVANAGLRFLRWLDEVFVASGVSNDVIFDAKLDLLGS